MQINDAFVDEERADRGNREELAASARKHRQGRSCSERGGHDGGRGLGAAKCGSHVDRHVGHDSSLVAATISSLVSSPVGTHQLNDVT